MTVHAKTVMIHPRMFTLLQNRELSFCCFEPDQYVTCEFETVLSVWRPCTARSIYRSICLLFSFSVVLIHFSLFANLWWKNLSSTLLTKNVKPIVILSADFLFVFLALNPPVSNHTRTNTVQFHLLSPHYIIILGNGWSQQKVKKQVKTGPCKCVIMITCHYLFCYQFCTLSVFIYKKKESVRVNLLNRLHKRAFLCI